MAINKLNATFDQCLDFVLEMEGGFVDHPADRGGATNKGITQSVYDSYRLSNQQKKQNVKHISSEEVARIYHDRYWLPCGCGAMPPKLALTVFDLAVNMGIGQPFKYLNEFGVTKEKTWNSRTANDLKYYLSKHSEDTLVQALHERRVTSYRRFVQASPSQKVFLQGWLNRVQHLKDATKELT